MSFPFKMLFSASAFLLSTQISVAQNWQLIWSDEFEKDGPVNAADWNTEQGFTRNHEAQWFQAENAFCKNGHLIIEARQERVKNPGYIAGSQNWKENREFAEYTSASITTRNKHSWQYGRFEIKAKIDTRPGLWPAFWTLGIKGEWPDNGEIDIMEFYRGMLLANLAWGSDQQYKPVWNSVRRPLTEFQDKDWSSRFHIFRMDWDEKSVKLYVDDMLINTQQTDQKMNTKNKDIAPFNQPHYLLLTLAIGGDNGGDPSQTTFPARYEIDYVRVYQKK